MDGQRNYQTFWRYRFGAFFAPSCEQQRRFFALSIIATVSDDGIALFSPDL